jgi:hypothetical protein
MGDPVLKPLLIVLIDGFADWETPLIAGIGGDFYGLNARYVTPGGGDLTSIGGLRVAGLPDFLPRGDEVIVLCGSDGWCRADAPDLSVPLREAHDNGQTVAAICHGPWLLIDAGVVPGKVLTSYASVRLDLANAGASWVDAEVQVCPGQNWTLITSRNPDDIPAFNEAISQALLAA